MNKILMILAASFISLQAFAQAVPFLNIPASPVEMSLGGSSVTKVIEGKGDISAYYGNWAPKLTKTKMYGLDAEFKFGKIGFSVEGKFFTDPAYNMTGESGEITGTFSPKEMYIGPGISVWFTESFVAGVKARYISSNLYQKAKGSAFGADVFLKFRKKGFVVAASVCNLGTKIKYSSTGESYKLPSIAKLGVEYKAPFGLKGIVEADYIFNGGFMASAGAEYALKNIVFFRAGYHYGNEAKAIPSYASVGLGAKIKGFGINASYLFASKTLSNSFMVGLNFAF